MAFGQILEGPKPEEGTHVAHVVVKDDGDSEGRLLNADLSIDCDNDEDYRLFVTLNAVFIVVTQLIPILSFAALYRVRHLLHPPSKRSAQAQLRDRQKREQEEPKLKPVAFLCD